MSRNLPTPAYQLHGLGVSFSDTVEKIRADLKDRLGSWARSAFDEYFEGIKAEVQQGASGPWIEKLRKYLPEEWVTYIWNELRNSFLKGLAENPEVQVKAGLGAAAIAGVLGLFWWWGNSSGKKRRN